MTPKEMPTIFNVNPINFYIYSKNSAQVTILSPKVGDHLAIERITFSPSQRGHKRISIWNLKTDGCQVRDLLFTIASNPYLKKTALPPMKYRLPNCLILMMLYCNPITGYYHPLSGQIILIPVLTIIEGILGDSLTFHHHLGSFSSPIETTTRCPKSSWAHPHLVLHLL